MKRVLVIQKTSLYGQLLASKDASDVARVFRDDKALQERYVQAHDENEITTDAVHKALESANVYFETHARPQIPATENFDLVITVGGDGTFLDASHSVDQVPILGVNSSLASSVGHFCCAHVHNIDDILQKIFSGTLKPQLRYRLEVTINGVLHPVFPLNEVLFTHQIPAGTTRYRITVGGQTEAHKSCGVWIATASGSTGAIMSAGGTQLPREGQSLQYLVREPYTRGADEPKLLHGYSDEAIEIFSTSSHGAIFIDGPGERMDLEFGSKIVFRPGTRPLLAYVADPSAP